MNNIVLTLTTFAMAGWGCGGEFVNPSEETVHMDETVFPSAQAMLLLAGRASSRRATEALTKYSYGPRLQIR